ncbi:MAG: urate hydroxylase PuuD [Planctomycetes bacterium]|nr:urate hydroxylase PuuD [Planctomycetota bacterium]
MPLFDSSVAFRSALIRAVTLIGTLALLGLWPATTRAQATSPWDPSKATSEVCGIVRYEGKSKPRRPVNMAAEPACAAAHGEEPPLDESLILAPDGAVRNAFIWIRKGLEGFTFPVPAEPVALVQTNCTYVPHVFGIRAGQPLDIANADDLLHNINARPLRNEGFNFGQPTRGMHSTRCFSEPEVMVMLKCDVHGWMRAYAGVVSHPFFAVSGDDGAWRLPHLPPGEYTVEIWHETLKTLTQVVTLRDGERCELEVVFGRGVAVKSGGTATPPPPAALPPPVAPGPAAPPSVPAPRESPWRDWLFQWTQALARWIHVFAAMLWIGQTYLFHRFEHNLSREGEMPSDALGYVWLVHGGGFFRVEKRRYGQALPTPLLWFKWESAVTWLSGAVLITLTYYFGGLLTAPEQDYSRAAWVGVGVIAGGWIVYDLLARTPLGKKATLFTLIGLGGLMGLAAWLPGSMSTRSAYIHIGALIGTIMAANVWMKILPAQRRMLALAQSGSAIDPRMASVGPQRSRHNSFLTLPLVFMMVSSHYPTISYGHERAWLIVGVLLLLGFAMARVLLGGTPPPRPT